MNYSKPLFVKFYKCTVYIVHRLSFVRWSTVLLHCSYCTRQRHHNDANPRHLCGSYTKVMWIYIIQVDVLPRMLDTLDSYSIISWSGDTSDPRYRK